MLSHSLSGPSLWPRRGPMGSVGGPVSWMAGYGGLSREGGLTWVEVQAATNLGIIASMIGRRAMPPTTADTRGGALRDDN
eukprot:15476484-Alexandrium_andersonii.AAC.1